MSPGDLDAMCRRAVLATMLLPACLLSVTASATGDLRESFALQVPVAPALMPVDGSRQLVYELHLTNLSRDALVIERVVVADAGDRRALAAFDGEALAQRLGRPGTPVDAAANLIAPGLRGVLHLEVEVGPDAAPQELQHHVAYTVAGVDPAAAFEVLGARVALDPRPLPVLGPPLRGGPWAAIYSPVWERGHRRVLYTFEGRARLPGRLAIDFFGLDADGRLAPEGAERVEEAVGYGAEVLAVADATVAVVRDDIPETGRLGQVRARQAPVEAAGNYIVLALGDGRYAFYEHLAPGSVRVAVGDRVRRGQTIAALGSTGDSSRPHLHFHLADGDSPLAAEGLPFAFEAFDLLGRYDDFSAFGLAPWTPLADPAQRHRRGERPPPNVVVAFDPDDGGR